MNDNPMNILLTLVSWASAIIASICLDLSPFWDAIIRLAPWVSTAILYLTNFDKVNKTAVRIWNFIKSIFS